MEYKIILFWSELKEIFKELKLKLAKTLVLPDLLSDYV